jgi:hypothetical protein
MFAHALHQSLWEVATMTSFLLVVMLAAAAPPAAAPPSIPVTPPAPAAAPAQPQGNAAAGAMEKVRQGIAFFNSGRVDDALRLFVQAANLDPQSVEAHYCAGVALLRKGSQKPALGQLQAAAKLDPKDWRVQAGLVQCCQAAGAKADRDAARAALLELRKPGGPQALLALDRYCREQFTVGRRKVVAYEYFDLKGERLYHLDGYYAGGVYKPFTRFKGEPAYELVRKWCVDIVSGKVNTGEGVTPAKGNTTIGFDPNSGAMGLAALLGAAADAQDGKDACPISAEPDREVLTAPSGPPAR